jgi:oligopeptide transport system permease protein
VVRYLLRRIGAMCLALFLITSLTFFMMKAVPGGPYDYEKRLPEVIERNINNKYHLNDPWILQYRDYLLCAARFDFGPSFTYQSRSVNEIISEGFPVSAQLGIVAVVIALFFGLILGVISALKKNKIIGCLVTTIMTLGFSIPSFVIGFGLMYLFAYKFRFFPPAMWGSWKHMVLPAAAMALFPMAVIARLVKFNIEEVLQQDYIKTARAKGLPEIMVVYRHGLKNALLPVITYLGPLVATVFTGSFVIEYIFNIPGLGQYYVSSIQNRDYTLIMGTTVFYSAFLMLLNLVVDIIYGIIDPRIKLIDAKEVNENGPISSGIFSTGTSK